MREPAALPFSPIKCRLGSVSTGISLTFVPKCCLACQGRGTPRATCKSIGPPYALSSGDFATMELSFARSSLPAASVKLRTPALFLCSPFYIASP
jgi:hypothetical protein